MAALEAHRPVPADEAALALGVPALDRVLGGGLMLGALHEIVPAAAFDLAAAAGMALALAAHALRTVRRFARREVLWIQPDLAGFEAGRLYGPGLEALGLPLLRLIDLRVASERDGAFAMEEALQCRALAVVVGEFFDDRALDLVALRRLSLAAATGGGLGLVLRHRADALASPAATRLEIAAAPSRPDAFGGLGRPTVLLSVVRNRHGPTGRWLLSWDHHEHVFVEAPSLAVAVPAVDRPDSWDDAKVGRRAG
ncbi:MAG: DNA repair protein [Rhodoplanes sp.]|uniref:ImuA family protein n=1 Tax=Rhodoplanes sp. TaxID=1968906 RepID=UPI0018370412|nr:DNA repair protein [Rhodoplanes sp.]NVO12851.1 DNA repair protein [Rhodoplanes sp.]